MTVVILGCGYTGERVARRFLNRAARVVATSRHPERLTHLISRGAAVVHPDELKIPDGAAVLDSIPVVKTDSGPIDPTPDFLREVFPARVVYLSTTGVYGEAHEVDTSTPVAPRTESDRLRVAAEDFVEQGPWSSLILRPAAIYGPGRGVHARIRSGDFRLAGDGSNYVSRIHADDLAALIEAALLSRVEGRFPVADDEPCTSREIAEYCAALLHMPVPGSANPEALHPTRRADRRVDGRAIRQRLSVELKYPSYKSGIPAALAEEAKSG